jgi:uncharacterized protein YehS (DUF1456 family)
MVTVSYTIQTLFFTLSREPISITSEPHRFCACLRRDPQEELERVSVPILFTFLDWVLNLRRGKNGRRLPGVKCKSSLDTFWKVLRLVYENETSNKIRKQMNRQMRRV